MSKIKIKWNTIIESDQDFIDMKNYYEERIKRAFGIPKNMDIPEPKNYSELHEDYFKRLKQNNGRT